MAEGEDELAHAQPIGVAQHRHRQPRRLDLDQGQIHALVMPDEARLEAAAVGELDLDALGIGHDVGIGDKVAVLSDDEAGP